MQGALSIGYGEFNSLHSLTEILELFNAELIIFFLLVMEL